MDKTKLKGIGVSKRVKRKTNIKKDVLKKIDSLSWEMGKKIYSSRKELYDR